VNTEKRGGDLMTTKVFALAVAMLSLLAAVAPSAYAKRGNDDIVPHPECQMEDDGLVCR